MITLYLHGEIAGQRRDLETFLHTARIVYERPGGIRTRLQWELGNGPRFVEIIEYADRATYEADQERTERDPEMRELLARWRGLLAGAPRVEVFEEVGLDDAGVGGTP